MSTEKEVEELIDELFSVPEDDTPSAPVDPHLYPEQLLHIAPQGNKYYHSLQQYKRQFLDDLLEGSVINFAHSRLNTLLRKKVSLWDGNGTDVPELLSASESAPSVLKTANALFSWSSGDQYIRARKEELRSRSKSPVPVTSPTKPSFQGVKKPSFPVRLHQVVDSESNKFIQDRIDIIKARRLEQASKRVSERKQRDHDRYMERMRQKEEEYDKALNAAIKLKKENKNQNFFGTLFSFGKSSKHQNSTDASDNNLDVNTISSSKSSIDNPMAAIDSPMQPRSSMKSNELPVTPKRDTNQAEASSPLKTNVPASPEPQIVGIDDAFASMAVTSNESDKNTGGIDDLLGLPPPPQSKIPSPQKHRFIPLGAVPKKPSRNDQNADHSEDLLQL